MAHTRVWEETHPLGTEAASLGDDRIVALKIDLGERLEDLLYGFNVSEGTGNEATPGIKVLNFKEQTSIATPSANQINIASKVGAEGDAKAQLWAKDEDGNERQLTKTSGSALRLNVKAGDYAADSVDEDDIRLANNSYLTGRNQAGDGDINVIKVNTSNEVELGEDGTTVVKLADGSKLASNAAPDGETELVNKKYVDDTVAAEAMSPDPMTGDSDSTGTVTFPNGLIWKWGKQTLTGFSTAVIFASSFPSACFQAFACGGTNVAIGDDHNAHTISKTGFTIQHATQSTLARWFAVGR